MLLVTRIAFGISFGLAAADAMAAVAVALQRSGRYALIVFRKSPKPAAHR